MAVKTVGLLCTGKDEREWEVEFNGILPYISSPGQQCCFDSLGQWYSALKAVVGGTKPGYACRCWGIGAHLGPAALGHCVRHRIVGLAPPNTLAYTKSDRYVKGISSYYLPFFKNANSCYQQQYKCRCLLGASCRVRWGTDLSCLLHNTFCTVLCTVNQFMQGPMLIYSWNGRFGKWGCSRKMGEQCGLGLEECERAVGGRRKDWRQRRRRALTGPWHKFLGGGARQIYSE